MGFAWMPQLCPGDGLEGLVEGAEAAGEREKGLRERVHPRLALVHRGRDVERREARVRQLARHHALRDDARHVAARRERRVGHRAHEAHAGAAVDDAPPAPGDGVPHVARHGAVARGRPVARPGEDADAVHRGR